MSGFDWPALMRAGMRGLGLSPEAFWRLTPAELRVLLGADAASAPLGRSRLDQLLEAYPDQVGPLAPDPENTGETENGGD
jgi:uncharacterized phage protein (TIGR02216 family)